MELTSIVFSFLKDNARLEAEAPADEVDILLLPRKWTTIFARLALVNHAFFHASTEILWETMDTLHPFFEVLLGADRTLEGRVYRPLVCGFLRGSQSVSTTHILPVIFRWSILRELGALHVVLLKNEDTCPLSNPHSSNDACLVPVLNWG